MQHRLEALQAELAQQAIFDQERCVHALHWSRIFLSCPSFIGSSQNHHFDYSATFIQDLCHHQRVSIPLAVRYSLTETAWDFYSVQ